MPLLCRCGHGWHRGPCEFCEAAGMSCLEAQLTIDVERMADAPPMPKSLKVAEQAVQAEEVPVMLPHEAERMKNMVVVEEDGAAKMARLIGELARAIKLHMSPAYQASITLEMRKVYDEKPVEAPPEGVFVLFGTLHGVTFSEMMQLHPDKSLSPSYVIGGFKHLIGLMVNAIDAWRKAENAREEQEGEEWRGTQGEG